MGGSRSTMEGALVAGVVALAGTSVLTSLVVHPASWGDWLVLLLRVADPVSQVENVNVGALAYRAGPGRDPAMALHWLSVVLAVLAWLVLSLRRSSVTGYMATVVVAQLVSPILWDHYAVVLLVPVAWLLSRGLWWAAGVPLLSPSLLGASVPAFVYAVAFWGTLLALSLPRLSRATNT